MALISKIVNICIIGWACGSPLLNIGLPSVAIQAAKANDKSEGRSYYGSYTISENPSSWSSFPLELPPLFSQIFNQIWTTPKRPTPPTPVQLPEWMITGIFPTFPTPPVAPVPVQLPEWMTSGRFPTPIKVELPDWMTTGELPNLPKQPDLTSGSVVNTKPGDHLQYNGVVVRSSNDGDNSGTSMATNDNGKVKLAKDGPTAPDLNKPLPSMDPKARFSSFSSSSFSSSKTVDGKTVSVGGSDTKVNNDGKVDTESIQVVQEDKASGWKEVPLDKDEIDIEDEGLDEVVTVEDDDSESSNYEEFPKAESKTSSHSTSSSSSSSSKDGEKPKFISSSISSFSSSSDANGVKDKVSGSSTNVNDNGKVFAKNAVNIEKLDATKKGTNYIGSESDKNVIPLPKDEDESKSDEVVTAEDDESDSSFEEESPNDGYTKSSSTSSSSSSSSSSKDGERPKFTSSSKSSYSSSSDVNGVKEKVSGSSIMVNDNGKVVAEKATTKEKHDASKKGTSVSAKNNEVKN